MAEKNREQVQRGPSAKPNNKAAAETLLSQLSDDLQFDWKAWEAEFDRIFPKGVAHIDAEIADLGEQKARLLNSLPEEDRSTFLDENTWLPISMSLSQEYKMPTAPKESEGAQSKAMNLRSLLVEIRHYEVVRDAIAQAKGAARKETLQGIKDAEEADKRAGDYAYDRLVADYPDVGWVDEQEEQYIRPEMLSLSPLSAKVYKQIDRLESLLASKDQPKALLPENMVRKWLEEVEKECPLEEMCAEEDRLLDLSRQYEPHLDFDGWFPLGEKALRRASPSVYLLRQLNQYSSAEERSEAITKIEANPELKPRYPESQTPREDLKKFGYIYDLPEELREAMGVYIFTMVSFLGAGEAYIRYRNKAERK